MKILYDDKPTTVALILDKKEAQQLIEALAVVLNPKNKLNKRSNAYKIALAIDNELPVF